MLALDKAFHFVEYLMGRAQAFVLEIIPSAGT